LIGPAPFVEAEMQDMKTGKITTKDTLVFVEPKIKCALPLNETNFNTMRNAYGPIPRNWIGKRVELYVDTTVRNPSTGEVSGGVRLKPLDAPEVIVLRPAASIMQGSQAPLKDVSPQAGNGTNAYAQASQPASIQPAERPPLQPASPPQGGSAVDLDDEIPFAAEWRG
jgi:hypothetical protein